VGLAIFPQLKYFFLEKFCRNTTKTLKSMSLIFTKKTIFRLMKISLIQLILITCVANFGYAYLSYGQVSLQERVSISVKKGNIKSVLTEIEKQSNIVFSYQKQVLPTEEKLNVEFKNETVESILRQVLTPRNITFQVFKDNQILLTKNNNLGVVEEKPSNNEVKKESMAIPIKGKVVDNKNEPMIGVSVQVKGTTIGASTNAAGEFSISVPNAQSVLVFTFIGYAAKQVTVGNRTVINITLEDDIKSLDEIVVVGYATTSRKDILGSVGSIKEKQIVQTTPVNAFDAVQGRLAGVQINSLGGPGEGSSIRIRGVSTFEGGANPLYIVDGQQLEDINNLNPNDIASMEVLKDGASAAIYGSKSANGVVIITTKSGKNEDLKVNVDFSHVISTLGSNLPLANTKQRFIYENIRAGRDPNALLNTDSLNILFQYSPDVQAFLYKPSSRNQLNVGLSGGKNGTSFYWNNSILDEQGTIINTSYQRFSTRLKVDADVKKRVTIGSTLNLSYELKKGINEGTVFEHLIARIPYFPLFEPDGSYSPEIAGRQNPLAEADKTVRDTRNFRVQSQSFVQLNIANGFTFRSTLGVNFRLAKYNNFDPTIVQTIGRPATGSEAYELSHDIQQENFFTFRKKKGVNNFTAILGNQIQHWNFETTDLRATAFSSDNIQTFNNVAAFDLAGTNSWKSVHALTGVFGSLSYDYKGKYLINGTLRRDGSSRFGENRRYGWFPSGSIGWRISGENFMKNAQSVFSNLLVKASIGTNGNERMGTERNPIDYASQLLYVPGSYYNAVNSYSLSQLSNPVLGWESTQSTNLGIVGSMFKSRFDFEIDFWRKDTKDLLYNVPLPKETGFSTIRQNIGSIRNEGIDISLNGVPYKTKDFEWSTNFNITFLQNKVLQLAQGTRFESGSFLIEEGQPLGNIFGYKNLGVFPYNESNAFTDDGKQLTPVFDDAGKFSKYTFNGTDYTGKVNKLRVGATTLQGGDIFWADLNNDFNIDGQNDRMVIGNGTAKYFGGFNNDFRYKGLTLSVLIDYNFGNQIYRAYDFLRNDLNSANETPSPDRIDLSWRKAGDVAPFATLDRARTNNAIGPNSQYISGGDYIRWRSVRINYSLPPAIYKQAKWLSNVSFNFSVNNLMTFTNYPGYNPDLGSNNALQTGLDNLKYPNRRDFILGLKFQL
jgi:TonB-dependent starch-binding outer membrane protein SusC